MSDNEPTFELSRRTLMAGLGTIGVASAGAGIGTTSFFSDEERFDGNELVAGELDLKVDWQTRYYGPQESEVYGSAGRPYVNAFPDGDGDGKQDEILTRDELAQSEYGGDFDQLDDGQQQDIESQFRSQFTDRNDGDPPIIDLSDVKPGDDGCVSFSLHLFDNPGWIQMMGELLENAENTVTEPEASDPDEDDDEDTPEEERQGELAQTVRATVWYDEDGDCEIGDSEPVIAEGTLVDVLARLRGGITLDGDRTEPSRQPFENSTTHHVGFRWELPVDHANEIQTDSASFTLGFYTEQSRHNPRGPSLEPYQDELPSIPTADATADGSTVSLTMQQATHRFHEDLPATTVWGYHDGYLGPTIEAREGNEVTVEYTNGLPANHLLPVDTTLHGADGTPTVRNVPHLHGGNVPDEVDGWPEAWVTPDGDVGTGPGVGNIDTSGSTPVISYTYPNTQPASQLWYHDHALGITRLNVYAGLAGLYTLRDQTELGLLEENRGDGTGLPSGDYEVPLVLQGKSFEEDGSLAYPDGSDLEDPEGDNPSPSAVPEFFGDTAVVNGKAWPYLEVEPRKYRFRMINACNSRFLSLKLYEWDENSHTIDRDSPGPGFTLVGTDGGLLESPTDVPDRLLMNPANRFDVVIDFSGYEGRDFVLQNAARSPFKAETQAGDEQPLPEFMLFRVKNTTPASNPDLPSSLAGVSDLGTPDEELDFALEEGEDTYGRLLLLLNDLRVGGSPSPDPEYWSDPVTTTVQAGHTQVWNLYNLTEDVHPIHLHLVQFQIVGRKAFDAEGFLDDGKPVGDVDDYVGEDRPLNPRQEGWHDTVAARPGELTQVKATFGAISGTAFGEYTGEYPWHCHILEHEDHEMMRPYEVQ